MVYAIHHWPKCFYLAHDYWDVNFSDIYKIGSMLLIKLFLLKYVIWLLIITYKNMVDKHIYQWRFTQERLCISKEEREK